MTSRTSSRVLSQTLAPRVPPDCRVLEVEQIPMGTSWHALARLEKTGLETAARPRLS